MSPSLLTDAWAVGRRVGGFVEIRHRARRAGEAVGGSGRCKYRIKKNKRKEFGRRG